MENGDTSSPALSWDGVFLSYPCQVYRLDLFTGSVLWHYAGPCEGGGGKTAAYAGGRSTCATPARPRRSGPSTTP